MRILKALLNIFSKCLKCSLQNEHYFVALRLTVDKNAHLVLLGYNTIEFLNLSSQRIGDTLYKI